MFWGFRCILIGWVEEELRMGSEREGLVMSRLVSDRGFAEMIGFDCLLNRGYTIRVVFAQDSA